MKWDEPKAPDKPNDLAEQFKELLTLRRKVRAAEITALSRNGRRPDKPINRRVQRCRARAAENSAASCQILRVTFVKSGE
jgi:uncharacterized NAD(P)/FAD-binding protein YdhS